MTEEKKNLPDIKVRENLVLLGANPAPPPDPRINYGNNLMWVVAYRNNRTVCQYDQRGRPRSFQDLPREDMKRISMITINEGKLIASQDFIPGMSPIYRQRTLMAQSIGTIGKVHLIGWAIWDGKRTVTNLHIAFINEATYEVEMGHFVEGRNAGFKYPIQIEDYDYQVISWTK